MNMQNHLYSSVTSAHDVKSKHPFIVSPNRPTLTYAQFYQQSRLAAGLFLHSGLTLNGRVAVVAEKSASILAAYLGTVAAGGIFVPINPSYTNDELQYFIDDVRPDIVICANGRLAELRQIAADVGTKAFFTLDSNDGGTFLTHLCAAEPAKPVQQSKHDLAAILYTSGTTGKPKGAMLSHGALASNAVSLTELWQFTKNDRLLHILPVHHTHGLFVAVNIALISGCSMIFLHRFDPVDVVRSMADATAMMGVPTHYGRLLQLAELNTTATRGMRLFVSGSAPLAKKTHTEWTRRTGHRILNRYGMTEANMICSIPYDGPRKPNSVGVPLPGVKIRLRDIESGEIATTGKTGILELRSPGLFSGYWGKRSLTRREFTRDGYFISGDIARIDEDGFTEITGRAKDIVISGGVNLYPSEIEAVICQFGDVAECAVVGVPHPDLGECAIAVVVSESTANLTECAVFDHLVGKLARFKHPKHIAIRAELPRNAMGKISKNQIKEEFQKLFIRRRRAN